MQSIPHNIHNSHNIPDSAAEYFESITLPRHRIIEDSLRLNLKIAADGYPELSRLPAREICRRLGPKSRSPKSRLRPVFDAAAAVFAHELYFSNLPSPIGAAISPPDGKAADLLSASFGSADNFFYLARTVAKSSPDPAFLWLYAKGSRKTLSLGLSRLPLCTLPDLTRCTPLMCIDLWEHAYMDPFGEAVGDYVDLYLRSVSWDSVFADQE